MNLRTTVFLLILIARPAASTECHGQPVWQDPVVARTEATLRALALEPDLDRQLQAARKLAWEAERAGHVDEAGQRYEQNWEMLPPSPGRWDSSVVVAVDGLDFHFTARRWDNSLRWAQRLHIAQQGSQNAELLIWLGKIRFEQGMLNTARACFSQAYQHWGERIFSSQDEKYWAFFQQALEPDGIAGYYRAPRESCIDMGGEQAEICRTVFDTIEIAPCAQGEMYVQIGTRGPEAHQCWFSGIGRWLDDALIVSTAHRESGALCKVAIKFAPDAAWYEIDAETLLACFGYSTNYFCSKRADLAPGVRHARHARRADRPAHEAQE